jgi:polyphosphate kinase 2 (PPK2 family)
LPARGYVAVFNRSYYEEVLVVRVHPELLDAQRLPPPHSTRLWQERYESIVEHERHLARQGTVILKFWLNVSKQEQHRRFVDRTEKPHKRWKFRDADLDERAHWDAYMTAYQACLNATSRPWAPWYAIPADNKPYMRWQVATLINGAFEQLGINFPQLSEQRLAEIARARARLQAE